MRDDLAAAVGRAWLDDRPWRFLTDLTAIGDRMAGSPGERQAADLIAAEFRAAGLEEVQTDSFPMRRWVRGTSKLVLVEPHGRSFEAIALPYSPGGSVRGELVDIGHGTPMEIEGMDTDLEGRIVLASTTTPEGGRFVHRMEKYGCAVDAGAAGFVFVNHREGQLPPTGSLTFGEEAPVPAVGVSRETGARLADHAIPATDASAAGLARTPRMNGAGTGELTVEAETRASESQNVLGSLGPANADRELLALAHYDAHDIAEGALDNGSGIATLLVAATVLEAVSADLDVRIQFGAVGGEEVGLLGSTRLADCRDTERVEAVLNVDGAGRHRDLVAMSHTSDTTAELIRQVADRTRQPIQIRERPHPFSDQWPFVRAGVPALQLHSESGERGRGWGHTAADTRDKVDDRNIREHGVLAALFLKRAGATETEIPRLEIDQLQTAFREADFETGMRAAGLWPSSWDD